MKFSIEFLKSVGNAVKQNIVRSYPLKYEFNRIKMTKIYHDHDQMAMRCSQRCKAPLTTEHQDLQYELRYLHVRFRAINISKHSVSLI